MTISGILLTIIGVIILGILFRYLFPAERHFSINGSEVEYHSAKEVSSLLELHKQEIDDFAKCEMFLGQIQIESCKGKTTIEAWYSTGSVDNPLVFAVKLDSESKDTAVVHYVGKHTKLYPGVIDLDKYVIDSDEAVTIAEKELNQRYEDFKYDRVIAHTSEDIVNNCWSVLFINSEEQCNYYLHVNPVDGSVSSVGSHYY